MHEAAHAVIGPARLGRGLKLASIVALTCLGALGPAKAHIVPVGLGMQTYVKVEPGKLTLQYNLGYSSIAGYPALSRMETSGDNVLQREEIEAWLDRLAPELLLGLEVKVDGKPVAFKVVDRRPMPPLEGLNLHETNGAFDTWWTFESEIEFKPGTHTIEVHDNNFLNDISESLMWVPRPLGSTFRMFAWEPLPAGARQEERGTEVVMFARGMRIYVEFAPWVYEALAHRGEQGTDEVREALPETSAGMRETAQAAARALAAGVSRPATVSESAEPVAARAGRSTKMPGADSAGETSALLSLKDRAFPIAVLLALLWGAAHALAPGHGKSMVAAYLLGTDGRVSDALWLGASVTFAHVGSIFLAFFAVFGVVRLVGINEQTASGLVQFGLQLVAGLLVVGLGVSILRKRVRQWRSGASMHDHHHGPGGHHHHGHHHHHHDHSHGETHEHEHDHEHPHEHAHAHTHGTRRTGKGYALKEVLSLGFSAGLQPCPAGIALALFAFAQNWFLKGVVLLVVFSAGLGLVLISIALSMIAGRRYLSARMDLGESKLVRLLPIVSALLLTGVGVYMVAQTFWLNPHVLALLRRWAGAAA